MSQQNNIAVNISAADLKIVTDAFKLIKTTLAPHLISLTTEERNALPKMGDKTVAFVNKVVDYTKTNPQFTPQFLDTSELEQDVNAVNTLRPLVAIANEIFTSLDDTAMLSGSEAYTAALMYYNNTKIADKGNVQAAKSVYSDLSERFPGRPSKKAVDEVKAS